MLISKSKTRPYCETGCLDRSLFVSVKPERNLWKTHPFLATLESKSTSSFNLWSLKYRIKIPIIREEIKLSSSLLGKR